jgi:succinate dehydrogenase/fumarate reductase flavoprotein subunit
VPLVAGAGMAGLVAAARLRELGLPASVLEKGDRPGGTMLLSSGVVWRHRTLDSFREECPGGDPALQGLIVERLDEALDWLERVAVPAATRETGNERTVGRRFPPQALTEALARAAGDVALSEPLAGLPADEEVVLATGGFAARLALERGLPLRAAPWSEGDGLRLALERGAATAGDLGEFYSRVLPAPPAAVEERDWIRDAQLYGRFAHVVDDAGRPVFGREPSWSENDLAQAIAALPGGTAWYVVDAEGAAQPGVHDRWGVGDKIAFAAEAGAEVRRAERLGDLGLGPLASPKLVRPPFTAVRVIAAITHTLGGLRVDERARVLREDGTALDGVYAAGVDAGGIASGGYASGLATSLVLGLTAAESIASR